MQILVTHLRSDTWIPLSLNKWTFFLLENLVYFLMYPTQPFLLYSSIQELCLGHSRYLQPLVE